MPEYYPEFFDKEDFRENTLEVKPENYQPSKEELEEKYGLTEGEYMMLEGDTLEEKLASLARQVMRPVNIKEQDDGKKDKESP